MAAACGSTSAGSTSGSGSVGGTAGASDGGAGGENGGDANVPPPPLPPGGGDWAQYRHDPRGGCENPAVFAASEGAGLRQKTLAPFGARGTFYVYTQAVLSGDLVIYTTAFKGEVIAKDVAHLALDPRQHEPGQRIVDNSHEQVTVRVVGQRDGGAQRRIARDGRLEERRPFAGSHRCGRAAGHHCSASRKRTAVAP